MGLKHILQVEFGIRIGRLTTNGLFLKKSAKSAQMDFLRKSLQKAPKWTFEEKVCKKSAKSAQMDFLRCRRNFPRCIMGLSCNRYNR